MNPALIERFMKYVSPEPNTGCWLWSGTNQLQYGRISVNGKAQKAHRVAYELFHGPIPEGMEIDHKCRMTYCVNPGHLEAVTGLVNRQRQGAALTECPSGHGYNPQNTGTQRGGRNRFCRICHRKRAREAYLKGKFTGG